MKKKGLSILLASAMVAAMLTGCGNDGGQSSGSSEASDSGSAADSGAAESEASDSGEEASEARRPRTWRSGPLTSSSRWKRIWV